MLNLRVERDGPAPRRVRSNEPLAAVLLVSRAGDDRELGPVIRRLESSGVPVARLDAETAASAGLVADPGRRLIKVRGQWISPTVTWLRHFSTRAMPPGRTSLRRAFAADSWQALTDQLDVLSTATIMSRDPGLLTQLAAARDHGVAIPATVVAADPRAAAALVPGAKLVIKALHRHFVEARAGLLHGIFPEVVDRADVGRIPAGPPVVVQEYIDHEVEVRVYYVHGQIAAAFSIVKSDPAQPWLHPELVRAERIEPTSAIATAAIAVASALSIDYGAVDFLITGGVPVFLEVNLAGDWRWLETRVRQTPVTEAVTAMLRSKHEEVAGQAKTFPADVNPVTFLSHSFRPIDVDDERSL